MTTITDDYMREMLGKTRSYSVVILKVGPHRNDPGADKVIWEHGRRNFQLRADGLLSIVCPIADGTDHAGIGIFNAGLEQTRQIMDGDPAVQAGVLVYVVHTCRGFPGSSLPA
jgi:hypothetical protein